MAKLGPGYYWVHSLSSALFIECTLYRAHTLSSARFIERTLYWAHALLSARFIERTLYWAHSVLSARFLKKSKARFGHSEKWDLKKNNPLWWDEKIGSFWCILREEKVDKKFYRNKQSRLRQLLRKLQGIGQGNRRELFSTQVFCGVP